MARSRLPWTDALWLLTNIAATGVLYPRVKQRNEAVAPGYVTARALESAVLMAR